MSARSFRVRTVTIPTLVLDPFKVTDEMLAMTDAQLRTLSRNVRRAVLAERKRRAR